MKKLMIMGAGTYQVPLIRTAKEMGIYTIAVSIPGKYPGFAYADEVLHINTVDAEAVLAAARERGIDGICTAGTDVAVMTIGRVNDALGLAGISYEAAKIACDKVLMKQCYASRNPATMVRIMELEKQLLGAVDFYTLGCNMLPEAAKVAWEGIHSPERAERK